MRPTTEKRFAQSRNAVTRLLLVAIALFGTFTFATESQAKIVAAYARGQGVVTSSSTQDGVVGVGAPQDAGLGMGLRLGARVLIFEGYLDYLHLHPDENSARAILGLRVGLPLRGWRLVGHMGGGAMSLRDPALTDSAIGPVVRGGVALERQIVPVLLLGGVGIEAEHYTLATTGTNDLVASTVMGNLYMLFELGI